MTDNDWTEIGITDEQPWEVEDELMCAPAPRPAKRSHPEFLEVTTHKFKSNIAHYIRLCEGGKYKGVILMRYNRRVGVYIPYTLEQ